MTGLGRDRDIGYEVLRVTELQTWRPRNLLQPVYNFVIGIFFATIIGFLVALGRLSPNWLLSRISGAYVEIVRNLPLLFQILFWYLAVLAALPSPRQSRSR